MRPKVGSAVVYLAWNINRENQVPYEALTLKQFRNHPAVSEYLFGKHGALPLAFRENIAGCDVATAPFADLGDLTLDRNRDLWSRQAKIHRRKFRSDAISELRASGRWEGRFGYSPLTRRYPHADSKTGTPGQRQRETVRTRIEDHHPLQHET